MKFKKAYTSLLIVASLTIFSWIYSCSHTPVIDNIPEVCFDRDVLPIFKNNCAISGCHDGGGESHFTLNSYGSIMDGISPGNPASSNFYRSIIGSGENRMPPGKPLTQENRMIIRVWIEQGAGPTTCPDTSVHGGGGGGNVNPRACFARDIQPVLSSKCATTLCHDIITHRGGYVFSSYTSTLATVRPGSPSGSVLYQSITRTGEDPMPPSGKVQLTVAEIDSVAAWIRYGALNENCGETCDTINPVTFSGTLWPILQSSCTGCHSGTAPSGGVPVTGYSDVSAIAANGTLMNALKGIGVPRAMPPGAAFSSCRIRQFEIWVNNGHLNN